ncbi:MAG TPA: PIN domain-containing protein [Chloroflexus aurantiacus]|uniref:PIN domain-containing protein n=1 Tax=Chloroflexus aurantiacus (strain ATCC 29366 / DSM 635 / J-10-fl) TaxID=324602 RepID=A9WGH7_CHLAA|nr:MULTISPECIES: PIN domain-containing protein [Chloroflexus]ABY35509.1 hypothetical protein Caur_2300 [Chloroflexus aurantiacus J-10-fl]GIV92047.1 MAG: hypothetical protein KatS3mg056_0756 [Chloroflexus sp.]HBW69462.1 PIN domain-containing protein [Chloroflexus aurantiacus]
MRFIFDTSVLIDYLRDDRPGDQEVAADAFALASQQGHTFLTLVSLMELYSPILQETSTDGVEEEESLMTRTRGKEAIERDLSRVKKLLETYGIRLIHCSRRAQEVALDILRDHRSPLGKNALTDSLIIANGLVRRAYLVTRDRKWSQVARGLQQRKPCALRVVSPVDLIQGRL